MTVLETAAAFAFGLYLGVAACSGFIVYHHNDPFDHSPREDAVVAILIGLGWPMLAAYVMGKLKP